MLHSEEKVLGPSSVPFFRCMNERVHGGKKSSPGTTAHFEAKIAITAVPPHLSRQPQGATESTFQVGQGPTATILLDERLYKRAKAAAAKTAERFYHDQRRLTGVGRVLGGGGGGGGGGGRSGEVGDAGPLYNRHCAALLDQFVKTQMLSHFLSEGGWD